MPKAARSSLGTCGARLRSRVRLRALAVGDQARRLGLGFGARVRDAPQLGLGLLALARQVQSALFFCDPGLLGLLRAALGADALAQRFARRA